MYDYKINFDYSNCEIYIQYYKGGEIYLILPLRFERLKKLKKLESL